jgi:hypothetical protein
MVCAGKSHSAPSNALLRHYNTEMLKRDGRAVMDSVNPGQLAIAPLSCAMFVEVSCRQEETQ